MLVVVAACCRGSGSCCCRSGGGLFLIAAGGQEAAEARADTDGGAGDAGHLEELAAADWFLVELVGHKCFPSVWN